MVHRLPPDRNQAVPDAGSVKLRAARAFSRAFHPRKHDAARNNQEESRGRRTQYCVRDVRAPPE
jgi:hypothetical protein